MSKPAPGSSRWWQDTALIAFGGVLLAIWLWDGPILYATWVPEDIQAPTRQAPQTLADMFDAGCLTQEHLRALVEDDEVEVYCLIDTAADTSDGPPERRLFP